MCARPVVHPYQDAAMRQSSATTEDLANWAGAFEAYGDHLLDILQTSISQEQRDKVETIYQVLSAVLKDLNHVVSQGNLSLGIANIHTVL